MRERRERANLLPRQVDWRTADLEESRMGVSHPFNNEWCQHAIVRPDGGFKAGSGSTAARKDEDGRAGKRVENIPEVLLCMNKLAGKTARTNLPDFEYPRRACYIEVI